MTTLPSLLSFERKLEISDALMHAGNWDDIPNKKEPWQAISISKRYNRSTQSAHGIDDTKKTEPNPVSSDSDDAKLPNDKDTLKISFTLRVVGNLGKPFACNDPTFEVAINKKVSEFKGEDGNGLKGLAYRYSYNIANGRFLWRNRVGADEICIHVNEKSNSLKFNAYDFALNDFEKNNNNANLNALVAVIQKGLNGNNDFVFLTIDAYVKLGKGQHVFPSQEMNMGEKKKVLFQLGSCAAMHDVKIGNALRTIDNWYGDEMLVKKDKKTDTVSIGEEKLPIAIEPYGSVTQRGRAYRPNKIDLYSLMIQWVNEREDTDADKKLSVEDKSYVVSNLIRGGVFSKKGK